MHAHGASEAAVAGPAQLFEQHHGVEEAGIRTAVFFLVAEPQVAHLAHLFPGGAGDLPGFFPFVKMGRHFFLQEVAHAFAKKAVFFFEIG